MSFTFDAPETVVAPAGFDISAFSVNLDKGGLRIAFYKTDAAGSRIKEEPMVTSLRDEVDAEGAVVSTRMTDAIARASAIAGVDVYAALKQALYEELALDYGVTGSIT